MADTLAETWRTGIVKVDQAPELEAEGQEASSDSHEESGAPAASGGPEV